MREAIEKSPNLGIALKDAMSAPLISVGQRFQAMEVKGKKVMVGIPATTEEQNALFEKVVKLDSSICKDKLGQKDLAKAKDLQEFLVTHAHSSQYMFQVSVIVLTVTTAKNILSESLKEFFLVFLFYLCHV